MILLRLPRSLRTLFLSISVCSAVILLSSCGGGSGGDNNNNRVRSASGDGIQAGIGAGSGCTSNVLNETKYDAIQAGMTRSQAQALVGCEVKQSFTSGTDLTTHAWHSEEPGRALSISFNSSQVIQMKQYIDVLPTVPASMPTPVAAICTGQHINQTRLNAIDVGLNRDEVNQIIGCAPHLLTRIAIFSEQPPALTAYSWAIVNADGVTSNQYMVIAFDDATGLAVEKFGEGL